MIQITCSHQVANLPLQIVNYNLKYKPWNLGIHKDTSNGLPGGF
jgi:hypothetical protein